MSALPSQQKALFLDSKKGNFVLSDTTVPKPAPGQLLVKIKATALNPIDWKIQKYGADALIKEYPAILGFDFSGDIVAVAEGINDFKVGDRVFALGKTGSSNDARSFQQFALADKDYTSKIPSNTTYEQAATLPLGVATAYLGMYNKPPHGMGLVSPLEAFGRGHYKDKPFIVLGGASSVGQAVLQFAKLSGFNPIITTASLKHTDYLKSFGATHILDRNLPAVDLISIVRKITSRPVEYVYDAISSPETQNLGLDLLFPGGTLSVVIDPAVSPTDKKVYHVMAARLLDYNLVPLATLYGKLAELVENGSIKPNGVEILPDGLNGIVAGLKRMEENKVSGVKLVIRPEETFA